MRYRPISEDPHDGRLGRFIPDDWGHVEGYPLTALPEEERPTRVPVVIGVNWYAELFRPEMDAGTGEYFVARDGPSSFTTIEGGHCVCLEPGGEPDTEEWWDFYDQGREGGVRRLRLVPLYDDTEPGEDICAPLAMGPLEGVRSMAGDQPGRQRGNVGALGW